MECVCKGVQFVYALYVLSLVFIQFVLLHQRLALNCVVNLDNYYVDNKTNSLLKFRKISKR